MPHHHHTIFVVLSLLVAVFGSWTALDLFRRVRSHIGRTRLVWLGTAGAALGASIWSMHFVAMLGYDPGAPVRYDLPLTFLSLVLAIGATLGAFFTAARERARRPSIFAAGAAMGLGICLMHYVGMAAVRTSVAIAYDPWMVAASLVVAVSAATTALFAARRERSGAWRAAGALLLGAAIAGMHYTAMAAVRIEHAQHMAHHQAGAPPFVLGAAVAGGTLFILFLALLASLYDQRLNVLGALDAGGLGYWELDLGRMSLQVSPKGREVFGQNPAEPFGLLEFAVALAAEGQPAPTGLLRPTTESGEFNAEFRLASQDGLERWVQMRGQVVAWRAGRPGRMAGVVFDVSERRAAFAALGESERRQRLLIDELNHRVKNTLATVQSIARQSARSARSIDHFREQFEARLLALSATHNALTRGAWEKAGLRDLLIQELRPHAAEQVQIDGEEVMLSPRQALALGMVFHELTTNAVKYGVLSTPTGRLNVRWAMADGRLELDWVESGGPPVAPPTARGFGSRLVQSAIAGELGGRAELNFDRAGLVCRLEASLAGPPQAVLQPTHRPAAVAAAVA